MKKWIALFLVLTLSVSAGCAAAAATEWKIEITDGSASLWDDPETPITGAFAGQKILYGFSVSACPTGKYISAVISEPESLNLQPPKIDTTFTMPAANVKITPVYSAQTAKVVDLRSGKHEMKNDADFAIWYSLLDASDSSLNIYDFDGVDLTFDLDRDGHMDLLYDGDLYVQSPSKSSITLNIPKAARYNPLTFVFANPKVSFSANGGSGTMGTAEVKSSNFSYSLPDCTFTPPVGKVFDKWDKGAPGTMITVTEDTVIKAVWKDKVIDTVVVSGGVYNLNHAEKTATFARPVKKTAAKLTIRDTVNANSRTYKVTEIKANACRGLKKLATVTIGKNVKTIGKNAFAGSKALKTVKGGVKVEAIGNSAFSNCMRLSQLPAFGKLKTIGAAAFKSCKSLTKITIGANVSSIGKNAFYGDAKLKTITIKSAKMKKAGFGANCFRGIYARAIFKVPAKALKNYTKWIKIPGKAPKMVIIRK